MIYIGIDPGLDGGIAYLTGTVDIVLEKTPVIAGKEYDIQGMKDCLLELKYKPSFATIENQISMPGQGLTSTLQTGKGFGIWLGLLAGLDIPYQVVAAQKWQRVLFEGTKGSLDTKAKSEVVAKRLFPTADFRKSDRSRVANDGLTDAACIAEYGRRSHSQQVPQVFKEHMPAEHYYLRSNVICFRCGRYIPGDTVGCI